MSEKKETKKVKKAPGRIVEREIFPEGLLKKDMPAERRKRPCGGCDLISSS